MKLAYVLVVGTLLAVSKGSLLGLQEKIRQASLPNQPAETPNGENGEEGKRFDLEGSIGGGGCKTKNCGNQVVVGQRGPRGFTGADGPGSTYPFASGVLPLLTFTNVSGLGLIIDIADGASSPVAIGPLGEITETQFAFTAPRNGSLTNLAVNLIGSFASSITGSNFTVVAILRCATTTSDFSDTALDVTLLLPGTTTTTGRFSGRDDVDSHTLHEGDRCTLQWRFNHTTDVFFPAALNLGLSGGVVFGPT
jgi:hypothetical protein